MFNNFLRTMVRIMVVLSSEKQPSHQCQKLFLLRSCWAQLTSKCRIHPTSIRLTNRLNYFFFKCQAHRCFFFYLLSQKSDYTQCVYTIHYQHETENIHVKYKRMNKSLSIRYENMFQAFNLKYTTKRVLSHYEKYITCWINNLIIGRQFNYYFFALLIFQFYRLISTKSN